MLSSTTPERRIVVVQLARFIVSGGFVTVVALAVYAAVALMLHWHPQLANFLAYVVGLATGYLVHSKWSFRGHGAHRTHATRLRFLAASLITYGLNSLWVWIAFTRLHLGPEAPMLLMALVTPMITFLISRYWVFR